MGLWFWFPLEDYNDLHAPVGLSSFPPDGSRSVQPRKPAPPSGLHRSRSSFKIWAAVDPRCISRVSAIGFHIYFDCLERLCTPVRRPDAHLQRIPLMFHQSPTTPFACLRTISSSVLEVPNYLTCATSDVGWPPRSTSLSSIHPPSNRRVSDEPTVPGVAADTTLRSVWHGHHLL